MVEIDLSSITGIKIADLTPAQLAAFSSALAGVKQAVEARTTEIKKSAEAEVFGSAAKTVATLVTEKLAWEKLPKLMFTPDADGKTYTVSYVAGKKTGEPRKEGDGKRATPTPESGKITINKIGVAKGGIPFFKDIATGQQYETLKELIMVLKQPADSKTPGAPEADRCWDISKRGIAASEIVTRYHAKEVSLIYSDGTEQLVEDAVKEMEAARAATTPPATTPPTPPPAAPVTP